MASEPTIIAFKAAMAAQKNVSAAPQGTSLMYILTIGALGALVVYVLWRVLLRPRVLAACKPKFLGHFHLYPAAGIAVQIQNKPENKVDAQRPPNWYTGMPFVEEPKNATGINDATPLAGSEPPMLPEPAMALAMTSAGSPLVLNAADLSITDVLREVRANAIQDSLSVIGLHGAAGATRVFVPRSDGVPWDVYGATESASTHTVAVFALPQSSWVCDLL